jgi:predicted nucleic acid-binding protein
MTDLRGPTVSDSTPLIYLAKIGRLSLLNGVFKSIYVPEAVFDEAVTQGKALNMIDAFIIEKAVGDWIIKERVEPEVDAEYRFIDTNTRLGAGEKEALKLCKQLGALYFIADDREARRVSRILNIKPVGTLGVLVEAHKQGLITKAEALQTMETLMKAGFRMSVPVYRRVLDEMET